MARFLKLDRMEIIGFKSFYGRTSFDFPAGITAVVGPNGCGKSNIGDAISWVLGEQRPTLLRSDRMEDMIFSGSEARRPLGMAEVSLHFKNLASAAAGNGHGLERAIAIPPVIEVIGAEAAAAGATSLVTGGAGSAPETDAAEDDMPPSDAPAPEDLPEDVVVTRRVYRSGESEYILNGRRCRLKDIQDLLARTEIGTRLYSTIEQGKIDQILSAKPKDRRAMFEEAAGILGYKSKRRQAELKLEATQANLLRLSDIITEVESQLATLKRQAARARRYTRLVEDLRLRRGAMIHRRLLAIDVERAAILAEAGALRGREAEAAAALARDEAELERLRLVVDESERSAIARRDGIHALDLEVDRLQERLRSGAEQSDDLRARLAAAAQEIAVLMDREASQQTRAAEVATGLAAGAGERDRADQERGRAAAAAEAAAAEVAAGEAALESSRADLMRHLDRAAGAARAAAGLEEQERAGRAALHVNEREAAAQEAAREALGAAIADLERDHVRDHDRAGDAAAALQGLRDEEGAAAARVADAEKRSEELKGRAAAESERLAALEELERSHAGYGEGVRDVLEGAAGCAAEGLAGERLAVPRGLEPAVAAALEGLLEAIVVPHPDEAARGIAHLKRSGRGRVAFLPAFTEDRPAAHATLPPDLAFHAGVRGTLREVVGGSVPAAVEVVLARSVLVDDLPTALALRAAAPDWIYVTPEGDIVRPEGSVAGGDGRAFGGGLLARKAERHDVARQAAETAASRDAVDASLPGLRAALASLQERRRAAETAVRDAERARFGADLLLKQKRDEMARIEAALPALAAARRRIEEGVAEAASGAAALLAEIAAADAERAGREEAIAAAATALAARRAALATLQQEAAAAGAAAETARQRLASLEREKASLDAGLAELVSTIARRGGERDECAARLDALKTQEAIQRTALAEALDARAGAAARDEAAHAGLAYDRSLLHARDQAAKQARAAHEQARAAQQEKEVRLARLEADLEHVEASCRADLGTTPEALRAAPAPEDPRPLDECQAELETLRAQVEGIGPVNLMAIEQHAELEERHTFLAAQRKDLEDAIASLQETIRSIDRRSRERFNEAFRAIQANFQESFTTLFGGGQAELRLQDGEQDVLEAGVEIVAQPPGKRLQKIGLLSGGEKALTAVALLFSVFRYRPSPFCVLDEVDAPLDEANVERFTGLLKMLCADTQFILITHNRKSMEAADLLYGVTMEEPGVSKVLPLRFE